MHATGESHVSVSDDVPSDFAATAGNGAEELVGALLTASRLFVAIATRSLAAVDGTLTVPQFRMLVVLDVHGPSSLVRLAERLGVNSSNALRMVERLSAAGMIEKAANPNSRREVRLGLTARGRRVVREATEVRRAEIGRIVAAMPLERRADLVTALRAFTDAAGEPPAEVPGWH
jgi:DNA-binding MarR family transcriptional regulator